MIIAALCIIAKTWKQLRCLSISEWIKKLWHIHTMEYYLAIKRNELLSHKKTCRDFKWILSSENKKKKNQSEKARTELFGRRVIDSLLSQFMPAALVYDTQETVSFIERRTIDTVSEFYKSMYRSESAGKSEEEKLYLRILMITDFISGMTDNYAKRLYQELFA